MATGLTKAKRKRTTKKNIVVNDIFPECQKILEGAKNEETYTEAAVILQLLTEAAMEVKQLDEEVSNLTESDDEYAKNEKDAYDFTLQAKKFEGKLQAFVEKGYDVKPRTSMEMMQDRPRVLGVKLPKIKIKAFDGDAVNWKTFIEAFDATVHARSDISSIEKFTYLRGYLTGSALQTIEGMPLTSDNYVQAKQLLETRYGNSQLIVSSHMNALLRLDKLTNVDAKELRNLHDKVEVNIRALETAGVSADHFGALLIPIILEKLPNMIR